MIYLPFNSLSLSHYFLWRFHSKCSSSCTVSKHYQVDAVGACSSVVSGCKLKHRSVATLAMPVRCAYSICMHTSALSEPGFLKFDLQLFRNLPRPNCIRWFWQTVWWQACSAVHSRWAQILRKRIKQSITPKVESCRILKVTIDTIILTCFEVLRETYT